MYNEINTYIIVNLIALLFDTFNVMLYNTYMRQCSYYSIKTISVLIMLSCQMLIYIIINYIQSTVYAFLHIKMHQSDITFFSDLCITRQ